MDLHHPIESAPIETSGISLLVTDMSPPSSSRHVAGCFVFICCISAMYFAQRRLYLIWSNANKQLTVYISSFQMESKISISGCFNKEQDDFNPVEVIHHWREHSVRWLLIFPPSSQLLNDIFIGQGLKQASVSNPDIFWYIPCTRSHVGTVPCQKLWQLDGLDKLQSSSV